MSENLTQIEKALLQEFESLAVAFATMARQQSQLSDHFLAETKALTDRQNQLETHLQQVSTALQRQNELTTDLIKKAKHLSGK